MGGVEQVIGKLGLERRKFLLDLGKAALFLRCKLRPSETVVAQVVVDAFALRPRQLLEPARSAQSLEFFIQAEVLRELRPVQRDFGQIAVVAISDRGVFASLVQVNNRTPAAP